MSHQITISLITIGAGPSSNLVLTRRSDSTSDARSIYLLLTVAKRLSAGFIEYLAPRAMVTNPSQTLMARVGGNHITAPICHGTNSSPP